MKKFIYLFLTAIFIFALNSLAAAQKGMIFLDNGVAVTIRTETTPAGSSKNSYGNIYSGSSKDVIHRILTDRKNKTYIGYDLSIERLDEKGKFRVSIRPLTKGPDVLVDASKIYSTGRGRTVATTVGPVSGRGTGTAGVVSATGANTVRGTVTGVTGGTGTSDTAPVTVVTPASGVSDSTDVAPVTDVTTSSGRGGVVSYMNGTDFTDYTAQMLPNYPADVIVEEGDTITLDLLENPETNTKIADVITISYKSADSDFYVTSDKTVRSFSIDDIYLKMETPDIYINGKKYETSSSVAGKISWIFVDGKGRFLFSYQPQPRYDFQKIGMIDDKEITFEYGGDEYRIVSKSPVLASGGKWNLWVMHDPSYRPTSRVSPESPFIFGAAGRVEYLFNKR